jgi:hypothetical protein
MMDGTSIMPGEVYRSGAIISAEELKGRFCFGEVIVDARIALKYILNKCRDRSNVWTRFNCLRIRFNGGLL